MTMRVRLRLVQERQLSTARFLLEKLAAHQQILYGTQRAQEHAMAQLQAQSFEVIINERPSEKEERLAAWKNHRIKEKRSLETQLHQISEEISQLDEEMERYAEPAEEEEEGEWWEGDDGAGAMDVYREGDDGDGQ